MQSLGALLRSSKRFERGFAEWFLSASGYKGPEAGEDQAYGEAEETWEQTVTLCFRSREYGDDIRRAERLAMALIRQAVVARQALEEGGWKSGEDGTLHPPSL